MTATLEWEAERARQLASAIDGWLSDAQGRALFDAAASTACHSAIVEMVCRDPRFHEIARIGSMIVARRTARRSTRAAVCGMTAGVLLYLYDVKRALGRMRRSSPFRPKSANIIPIGQEDRTTRDAARDADGERPPLER